MNEIEKKEIKDAENNKITPKLVKEYDLSGEVSDEVLTSKIKTIKVSPIDEKRESIRGKLASWLVGLLAILVIASVIPIVMPFIDIDFTKFKDMLSITLTPVIGLVGAVTGFYFGEKSSASD